MLTALASLKRLQAGNLRYVRREQIITAYSSRRRLEAVAEEQFPFAVILGCSDSRVPSEIVFDQGLGDLFVIRVAGNIVAPTQIGSVEFAVENFGTRLVVVLGHTHCGAVKATVDTMMQPNESHSQHVCSIVDRVRPVVEQVMARNELTIDLLNESIRANVRASVDQLLEKSTVLSSYAARGEISIVGAEYDIATGEVDFFHNLPELID
ncbi:MAG: carbonic anhydrase [Gammaproteobacteria bacterium]|jgi:carbonic anhydrase